MEDYIGYLFIALLAGFGIYSEIRKQKANHSENEHAMPTPAAKPIDRKPQKEQIKPTKAPVQKKQQQETVAAMKARKERETAQMFLNTNEGVRNTSCYESSLISKGQEEQGEKSEFAITSAEEARRAIIWSEILQRKY